MRSAHAYDSDLDMAAASQDAAERHPGHGEDCMQFEDCDRCGKETGRWFGCSGRRLLTHWPSCECQDEEE